MKNIFLILPKEKKLGANPKKQNEISTEQGRREKKVKNEVEKSKYKILTGR